MQRIKVLNLYAGIGGNRKLWENVDVTAVEYKPDIADVYSDLYPEDKVIVGDAHQYLIDHAEEYNFIWSSPPCPTHSVCNNFLNAQGLKRYPSMELYQEIIYLKHFFKGNWVVENVKSYYEPLIKPYELARHYFWSNCVIPFRDGFKADFNIVNGRATTRQDPKENYLSLQDFHKIYLDKYNITRKRLLLRNCVYPPLGEYVFNCCNSKQARLF